MRLSDSRWVWGWEGMKRCPVDAPFLLPHFLPPLHTFLSSHPCDTHSHHLFLSFPLQRYRRLSHYFLRLVVHRETVLRYFHFRRD